MATLCLCVALVRLGECLAVVILDEVFGLTFMLAEGGASRGFHSMVVWPSLCLAVVACWGFVAAFYLNMACRTAASAFLLFSFCTSFAVVLQAISAVGA